MSKVLDSTPTVKSENLLESIITKPSLSRSPWQVVTVQYMDEELPQIDDDEKDDPYRYGWRYISTTNEDGEVEQEMVGLTLYDLLHPQEGDFIVETKSHNSRRKYITNVLETLLSDDLNTVVTDDLRIDFNLPGIKPMGPDIAILFDIEDRDKNWATLNIKDENAMPGVVFEITSPSTRSNDFGKKKEYYAQAEIPSYVILDIKYDKQHQVKGYELFVYDLSDGQYVRKTSNEQGHYWIPILGVWLAVDEEGILCYDETKTLLIDHTETTQALNEERINHAQTTQSLEDKRQEHAETLKALADESKRAVEQEQIAKLEAERAAEQERIAKEQEQIAKLEAERAAEQERIAKEQEQIAKLEAERAVEQERIAKLELERARLAEDENARLRAIIAQMEGKT